VFYYYFLVNGSISVRRDIAYINANTNLTLPVLLLVVQGQ